MNKYTVYEILETDTGKLFLRKIETVKAINDESARRKAIIGTRKDYNNTRAYAQKESGRSCILS